MEKMRLWFERNEGIPPCRDTTAGFDMGSFWDNCCRGDNKELFAAALSESLKMKDAIGDVSDVPEDHIKILDDWYD